MKEYRVLGHLVRSGQEKIDPEEIAAVKKLPTTKNNKGNQTILKANQLLLEMYTKLPLLALAKTGKKFIWRQRQKDHFRN